MKPLDVKTKFYNAESDEVFLEAQVQNITLGNINLDRVVLEPSSVFTGQVRFITWLWNMHNRPNLKLQHIMWLKGCLFFRVTPLIMREMKIWIFKLFFPTFFYTFSQKCFYFPLQTDFSSTSANKTIKNAVHRSNIPNFRGIQNKGIIDVLDQIF